MGMEKIIQWCGNRGVDWGLKNKKLIKKYFKTRSGGMNVIKGMRWKIFWEKKFKCYW